MLIKLFTDIYKQLLFVFSILILLQGCSSLPKHLKPSKDEVLFSLENKSFSDYLEDTKSYISKNRVFMNSENKALEIEANSPFEIKPDITKCQNNTKPKNGILLIHGLGDSPYSMEDLAKEFSENCFLVRTILLPGHGTKPGDTLLMSSKQWYDVSYFALKQLKKDVENVYLGGFSTGANISTLLAYKDPEVRGLALYSPAFSLKRDARALLPFMDIFTDWLIENPIYDYAKYNSFSINSLQEFYVTSDDVKEKFSKNLKLDIPTFIAISENDSVVDVSFIEKAFKENFTNSSNKMMVFTKKDSKFSENPDSRFIIKDGFLPSKRIFSFSHMSIPNRSDNKHYGRNADYRNCIMRFNDKCEKSDEKSLWYGDYPDKYENNAMSRLTFNPYFEEMSELTIKTLLKF